MTTHDEALRALEKEIRTSDPFNGEHPIAKWAFTLAQIIGQRESESRAIDQALTDPENQPSQWGTIPDPALLSSRQEVAPVYQMMAVVGDEHDDPNLWMDCSHDDYERLRYRPDVRSRIVYTSTGQTSDARDAVVVAGQLMRAAMDMQEARELETMHISQPTAKRLWDDAKAAWDKAMEKAK